MTEKVSSKDQSNPIKLFFNPTNAQQLYSYIQRGLKEQYNVLIDNRYKEQLIEIMKMVVEPLPKRIPADVDPKWFVRTLNQQTLKEALPIFADIAKGNTKSSLLPTEHRDVSIAHREIRDNINPGNPMMGNPSTPSTSSQSTPIVDEAAYQSMMNQRMMSQQIPQTPQFADPESDYPDDVNDLYENAEQERHNHDVQPSPDINMELPFESMEGFNVRANPTNYNIDPVQDLVDRGIGFEEQRSTPINSPGIPSVGASRAGQLDFAQIAPEPAQMRVLIPKTSRNL
ncbi:MAG: hypothetical protein DRQ47_07985, partial [Gammaproteobacteria bacterium]